MSTGHFRRSRAQPTILRRHPRRWIPDSTLFVGLSRVGSQGAIWILIAVLASFYWRRPAIFLYVTLADLIAGVSSALLRHAIGRERPPLRFPEPHPLVHVPGNPSFPSGHAATSFACAATLAWLTPLLAGRALRPRRPDRVLARLRRRALPAGRDRRRRARPGSRYSSSPARRSPPTISPTAAMSAIQIPIPRPS